jgi:hypothetical protein
MNGNLGGYRATKALCEAVCRSPTARMCRTSDMILSAENNVWPETERFEAWIASGTSGFYYPDDPEYPYHLISIDDCWGWTQSEVRHIGGTWHVEYGYSWPSCRICPATMPVACCDLRPSN